MRSINFQKKAFGTRALLLSIAVPLFLVNARGQSLPSVNRDKKPAVASKSDIEKLIQLLLQRGDDKKLGENVAPLIGLEKSADVKQRDNIIKQDDKAVDVRTCYVVFSDKPEQKVPMCLFVRRSKQTATTTESRYFKVTLLGKLEKAVEIKGLRTGDKGVRGSAVTTPQDIESPAIKKEFDAEMAYWLKDWLKKETKKVPSKSASVAPAAKAASAPL